METYPARPDAEGLSRLAEIMASDHVEIEADLGCGPAEATVYGCDLSAEYVRINADYTT
jgi:glutamate N-acetyltransferase/amino-acid N-acetyltransferase